MNKQSLIFICLLFFYGKLNGQELPLHLIAKTSNKPIIVFFTGDGGWNSFSTQLADNLSKNGFPILALDTRKYFWSQKSPSQMGKDMQPVLDKYLKEWHKETFIIIGYSFGADVGAFLPNSLTDASKKKVKSMVLLSPGYSTSFEVKLMSMLNSGGPSNNEKYKVYPELLKADFPVSCIFGIEEDNDFKNGLKETSKIRKVLIAGSHHYNDDINQVVKAIIKEIN